MAAGSATFVVTGLKDIDRRLKRLPISLQRKVVRQAMRAGMKLVAAAVKAEAPVDKGVLKKNVVVRAAKSRRRGAIEIEVRVNPNDQTKKTSGKTGKTTYYPATIQYGRKSAGVPANPFMTRAFAAAGESARRLTLRALLAGVEREASSR